MDGEKLIRASDARKAILNIDPKSAYCIDSIPAVDAVKVVRCGECRFCDTADCPMSGSPGRVSASDFCSYGESRCNNG